MVSIPMDPLKTPQRIPSVILQNITSKNVLLKHFLFFAKRHWTRSLIWNLQTALDIALTEDDLAEIKEELTNSGYILQKIYKEKSQDKKQTTPLHFQ